MMKIILKNKSTLILLWPHFKTQYNGEFIYS
jgi:hypothetical protein